MGLFLDKPQTDKDSASGEGNGLKYGYSAMQGWRAEMEDAHSVHVEITPKLKNCSYFAVLDGHAGDFTSAYSSKCLLEEIVRVAFAADGHELGADEKQPSTAIVEGSDECNSNVNETPLSTRAELERLPDNLHGDKKSGSTAAEDSAGQNGNSDPASMEADKDSSGACSANAAVGSVLSDAEWKRCIHEGFLGLDAKLKLLPGYLSGNEKSGSTVIGVFITPSSFVFANCGDSRAILGRQGDVAFSSVDHKPYNEAEQARIERAGGSVVVQRVNGSLALSRSLGDFDYKNRPDLPVTEQLVTAEPEVSIISRADGDEFIVLACDGIWDVMSNEDVMGFVRARLFVQADLKVICEELLETCLAKGSKDNMSAIIITFPAAPQVTEEAVQKEKDLDAKLKAVLEGFVKEFDSKELPLHKVVGLFSLSDLDGLPPGGGLESKHCFIDKTLDELVPDRIKKVPNSLMDDFPLVVNMIRNANNAEAQNASEGSKKTSD